MIIDFLYNSEKYKTLSEGISRGLQFLMEEDLASKPVGKYMIDGDKVFAIIQEYSPKDLSEGKMEAHKNYLDIQYIITGSEKMGYIPERHAQQKTPYNPDKDVQFYNEQGSMINVGEGMFALFDTGDAHMPSIADGHCESVKKAVVKIMKEEK